MIEEITQIFPPLSLFVSVVLFKAAYFENQRWARARRHGKRGASVVVGVFVDITFCVSTLFWSAFLIAYFFDTTIWHTIALWLFSDLAFMVFAKRTTLLIGDNLVVWIIGTLAVYPFAVFLFFQVSWYGLLS